eukprot:TRINITY_DN10059_c0_g1_i5.p1 TRINITY_DN10059_c0_g1~~TRINITY_DN10059_c0_g1_i5.p1  ORF type:complete len:119 (+),score=25.58 TRINITY_DN10059_c0_g1_i5:126-482(+)
MIRRPPRSTLSSSSAASDVYKRQKPEGSGQGGDHLGDETVQVGVGWALNVEAATADVVDSLVVKHDGDIGVLEEGVGGEHGVVWLNDGGGHLGGWVGAESELGPVSYTHLTLPTKRIV